jgi:hypothetical protein
LKQINLCNSAKGEFMNRYVLINYSTTSPFSRVADIQDAEEQPMNPPPDMQSFWNLVAIDTVVQVGWRAENSENGWVFSELTYEDYVNLVAVQVRTKLGFATGWLTINPVNFKVNLGVATPAEQAAWLAYQQYHIAVSDVKTQADYPYTINWPVAPF